MTDTFVFRLLFTLPLLSDTSFRVTFLVIHNNDMNFSILKAIFASMEQGVVFIDDRNRIAYCNPAAEKIRKIKVERILGRSILALHPEKVHPKVLHVIEALRSRQSEGHHRMNIQMVKGKFYDNTYTAVWGPKNKYWGTIVVSKEITQRKKTEDQLTEALKKLETVNDELRRLNRMKDDFLSTVSHELKTPMISVMGYLGLILKEKVGSLTEPQRKFLGISYKNLLKLEKNINNLLDLAEIGVQKESWVFEPTDLVKVIEFSCTTVDPLAKEHEIRLETQLPPGPVKIPGVEDKLNQLFDNLFTNAIKYNRHGGSIRVDLQEDAESVLVRIADTGVGISHQSLQEVFTRHFQEKTRPLGNARGLGIGLSLVQEIVTLHQGKIQIESELGKGTTFTVKLPRDR